MLLCNFELIWCHTLNNANYWLMQYFLWKEFFIS
jgi:hypothetical protein